MPEFLDATLLQMHLFPQPVVRIPVAGPDGYNTLVVVRETFLFEASSIDGKLRRYTYSVPTNFVLVGYDPRATIWQHSSGASLRLLQSRDDTAGTFDDTASVITAFDSIDA